jgi:hypothetical protein
MIRRFQNKDDEAMVIIGTAEVLGTGVTLDRASRLHLYEQNKPAETMGTMLWPNVAVWQS